MTKKRAVILLGAETPQCLYCIHSLMDSDFALICIGRGSVFYSSFNGRVRDNVHLDESSRLFRDGRVEKYFSEFDEILIYALNDDYLEFLIEEAVSFPKHVLAIIPDRDTVNLVTDKAKFLDLCRSIRVPVLAYTRVSHDLSLENLKQNGIVFPVILKPNRGSGARGFRILEDEFSFKNMDFTKFDAYHVQHYLADTHQYKYTASCVDGRVINGVTLHKTRYFPVSGGSCTFGTVVDIPDISKICSKIVSKLKWDGVIDFDILSPNENEYYPIEINPRLPASVRYSHCANVDFVADIFSAYPGFSRKKTSHPGCDHVFFVTLDLARSIFLLFRLDFSGINLFFKALASNSVKVDYYPEMPFSMISSIMVQVSKIFNIAFIRAKFFKEI